MSEPASSTPLRARVSAWLSRLPGPVWTMAVWSALSLAVGVLVPRLMLVTDRPGGEIGTLWQIANVVDALLIVGLLIAGARTPVPVLHLIVMVKGAFVLVAAAQKITDFGVVVSALGLIWVALYTALWWRRSIAFAYTAAASIGFLFVLILTGRMIPLGYAWAILTALLLSITAVVSYIVSELERRATRDPLTGLLNRHALDEYLAEFSPVGRRSDPRMLIAIDLDGFKQVNDTQGHAAGDAVLVRFAEHMRSRARKGTLIFRTGGDEFVILDPHPDTGAAEKLTERLRDQPPIECSIGVVQWSCDESFDTAVARADALMYAEKATRKRGRIRD